MEFFIEVFLIGVGLSMDAFAVSVCKGLGMSRVNKRHCLLIGLFFGGFQALMPFIGWLIGTAFESYVSAVDHWIAFILLAYIGGKMVYEALRGEADEETAVATDPPLDLKELFLLAVATSIDALAVGVTFAFSGTPILPAICIIGTTTALISIGGVFVGNQFGTRYEKNAAIAGGVILIVIGLKILIEGVL